MVSGSNLDWPGLLKWSAQMSDKTFPSTVRELSPTKIAFLEKALSESAGFNPEKKVKESLLKLQDPSSSEDIKLEALHSIMRNVEEFPEISRQFETLGALPPFLDLLRHGTHSVASLALEILNGVLPNNPRVQVSFWTLGGLATLMNDETDLLDNSFRFGALSGLMRHVPSIEQEFLRQGGYSVLSKGISSVNSKVQIKAVNLFRHLVTEQRLTHQEILSSDIPKSLCDMLQRATQQSESIQYGECCSSGILALCQFFFPPSLEESKQMLSKETEWVNRLSESIQQRLQNISPQLQLYEQEKDILTVSQGLILNGTASNTS